MPDSMHDPKPVSPGRRGFLIAAGSAGFTLAFLRADHSLADSQLAPVVSKQEIAPPFDPGIWFHIGHDGIVTVNIARAEVGQHIGTALARIVAEELEADWGQVRLHYVDSDPKWGQMVTAGSRSVWQDFEPLSRAGAAGRIALVEEGARLLRLPVAACIAKKGVVHGHGRSVSYGEIARRGKLARHYTPAQLQAITLKTPARRSLIGQGVQALDIPSKTDGSAIYGIDAQVEGLVYARPKIPPTRHGAKVVSIDDTAARKIKGYIGAAALNDPSNTVPGWVMVYADSYAAASRAAELVQVKWRAGAAAHVAEQDILAYATKQLHDASLGARVVDDDGVEQAFKGGASTLERHYTTSTVLHFEPEPVNALVQHIEGVWHVHAGNQAPSLILPVLAQALKVPQSQIVLHAYLLGGNLGRRLNGDYCVPAALAAQALGRPVKMICTRADDSRFDSPRSPSLQHLRMAFDGAGKVTAMQHEASAGWPTLLMDPALLVKDKQGHPYDPSAIAGADHWYTVGAQRVRTISNDLANSSFRPGWLRGAGPGWTSWAVESFMDEAAQAAKADPLDFRLSLLQGTGRNAGGAERLAHVLRRAAEKAGWGAAMPADTGLGIAATSGQGRDMPTWTACVARLRVDRKTCMVQVDKLTLVIDAGLIIDPDGALAQAEGGALLGLSMALHEGTAYLNGAVKDSNLNSYLPLRMADVPELDIEFVSSSYPPTGLGEPPVTVVAPAIGNAIFAAVAARVRHLPIRPEAVLKALDRHGAV